MERLLRIASPLGLYAEEFDVGTGRHLGNFPQAFSHLALIEAAARIIAAERLMLPSGRQVELAAGDQRAVIVEVGGGLRTYSAGGADLLDGYPADAMCSSARGQLLIPWPNRIEDGSYEFDGRHESAPAERGRARRTRSTGSSAGRRGRYARTARAARSPSTCSIRSRAIRTRSSSSSSTRCRRPGSGCRRPRRTSAPTRAPTARAPIRTSRSAPRRSTRSCSACPREP